VESTVYVAPNHSRKGVGSLLYRRLISELRSLGLHCAIGGIALPNDASIALHEILGFQKVAEFKEVGKKFNEWVSVGYWELVL
jgi:phosphinothricin acetyltransferase